MNTTPSVNQGQISSYTKLALVAMIWGGTFVAGRILSPEISGLFLATLRFLIASTALYLIFKLGRIPFVRPTAAQWRTLFLLGFFGIFLYNLFFFYGLKLTQASRASFIVAGNPAVIALIGFFRFRESLSLSKIAGIVCCLAGAFSIILLSRPDLSSGGEDALTGDLLIAGCVASWAVYTVFSRPVITALGPLVTVTYSIFSGTGLLLLASLFTGSFTAEAAAALTMRDILSLLFLGVIGSALAYYFYYDGIGKLGATRTGVFIALNPLTAGLCGYFILQEPLPGTVLAAGAVIICGIVLVNRGK